MAAINTQVWIYTCDSCQEEVQSSKVYRPQGQVTWSDGRGVSIDANVTVLVDQLEEGEPCICCDCAARVLRVAANKIDPF